MHENLSSTYNTRFFVQRYICMYARTNRINKVVVTYYILSSYIFLSKLVYRFTATNSIYTKIMRSARPISFYFLYVLRIRMRKITPKLGHIHVCVLDWEKGSLRSIVEETRVNYIHNIREIE